MKLVRRFMAIALATSLAACGNISPFYRADDSQIEQWVSKHQYARAIRALKQRPATEANRAQLKRVRERAQDYDRRAAAEVRQLQRNGDWATAFERLDRAILNYPQGEQLKAARRALERRQSQKLEQLQAELLVARAQWLIASGPLYRELTDADPDNPDFAWEAKRQKRQAKEIGAELSQHGIEALSRRELERAERYLALAAKLAPSERVSRAQERVADLRQRQAEQEQRARARERKKQKEHVLETQRQKQRQHEQRVGRLTKEVETALREADLEHARRVLSRLKALERGPRVVELERQFETAVASRVDLLIERGNRLYTDGEVARARQIWQRALELDPDNADLEARVQRAERVLNNLEELQQRNGVERSGNH